MVDKVNKVNKCKLEAGRKHLNVMYDVHYNDVHDRSMKNALCAGKLNVQHICSHMHKVWATYLKT